MRIWIVIVALHFLAVSACKKSEPARLDNSIVKPSETISASSTAANQAPKPPDTDKREPRAKVDACALLTNSEIQSVQGEPLKQTKSSTKSDGGFSVSQCFFTLPTFTNSISLSLTQRGEGADARNPREFWGETFGENREDKTRRKGEREVGEEEGEESAPRQKVAGLGQEAIWMGSRVGGALYVLKGNSYFRISIGGSGDQAFKLKKSRALAEKVLARM